MDKADEDTHPRNHELHCSDMFYQRAIARKPRQNAVGRRIENNSNNIGRSYQIHRDLSQIHVHTETHLPIGVCQRDDRQSHAVSTKNDVEIHTIVEPADLIVNADESLVVQVIVNLLKNAIEAGASTIVAHARYIQSKDCVAIDISDNAPEIAKEVAEQIFVPFFTTKTDGSGIGLSVSKRIMDLHNGSLQFIQPAKEPSCVKTFRMTLP